MSSRGATRGRRIFLWFLTRWRKSTRRLYEELISADLKADRLEKELQTLQKLMENAAADREYERACMMKRIQQLEEREERLRAVLTVDDPAEEEYIASSGAVTSGNNVTVNCDDGAASSTTVPPAASMSDASTDRELKKCPICLCGFITQEVGTPKLCNRSFCADCLQGWLKNTNSFPGDRRECDTILVRRSLGG
jgi:hypothetical protein